jgi:hypothetical protein
MEGSEGSPSEGKGVLLMSSSPVPTAAAAGPTEGSPSEMLDSSRASCAAGAAPDAPKVLCPMWPRLMLPMGAPELLS